MITHYVNTASALYSTVTNIAQDLATALVSTARYVFTSTTNSWVAQGATPTASAGAGSMFVPAGVPVILDGGNGVKVSVIRDTVDGKCSLVPVTVIR